MSKIHLKYDSASALTNNQVVKYNTSESGATASIIYDNGTNVGISTSTPSAKLHVKGVDDTSSNYALKITNSGTTELLSAKNNGEIIIGDASVYRGTSFYRMNNNGYDGSFYMNPNLGNGNNSYSYFDLNVGWIRQGQNWGTGFGLTMIKNELSIFDDYGVLRLNKDTYSGYTGYNNLEISFREGNTSFGTGSIGSFAYNRTLSFNDAFDKELRGIRIDTSLGSFTNSGSGTATNIGLDVKVGNGDVNYAALFNGGNVGIGTLSPSATLDVIGSTRLNGDVVLSGISSATTATTVTSLGIDETGKIVKATTGSGYRVYTALITQTGTTAPTVIVLENTIDPTISFVYNDVGDYDIVSSNSAFTIDKTFVISPLITGQLDTNVFTLNNSTTNINLSTFSNGTQANDLLDKSSFEIRVYN